MPVVNLAEHIPWVVGLVLFGLLLISSWRCWKLESLCTEQSLCLRKADMEQAWLKTQCADFRKCHEMAYERAIKNQERLMKMRDEFARVLSHRHYLLDNGNDVLLKSWDTVSVEERVLRLAEARKYVEDHYGAFVG